jgi:hypothetical protein
MVSLVTATIGVAMAVMIISLIRKDRLHVHHGLGWMVVAASFALVGIFPRIIDKLAHLLGIGYAPVLALTLGIAALTLKILMMDIERSRLEMRNQRLIQRVAMLEADLRKLGSGSDLPEDAAKQD